MILRIILGLPPPAKLLLYLRRSITLAALALLPILVDNRLHVAEGQGGL
jgi:hypothetical protein